MAKKNLKTKESIKKRTDQWMARNRSLVLRQTPIWAQGLAIIVISLAGIGITAGFVFRVDEIISVGGQLESTEGDTEVKTPVGGKISKVYVKNGETVVKGQPLLEFDTTQAKAEIVYFTNLIELEEVDLKNKMEIMRQREDVIERKIETNEKIVKEVEELQTEGGIGKHEFLRQLDALYELERERNKYSLERQRILVESDKAKSQYRNQLKKAKLQVQYQQVKATKAGIVFDMQIGESGVIQAGETLLTIIPQKGLKAKVDISNSDIGSIEVGQKAKIRVDAYPFTKYGEIIGTVNEIGADALPPDDKADYYRYPVEIKLDREVLMGQYGEVKLKNGMSITANIKLRDKKLIALLSDLLIEQGESVKTIRQK